ncbi:Di-trans,poly-cis-decaprenylcistransferase [Taphrina deformans PYCC 5710]|uniref:ditrans,polycis-polyprenyl diphosphate synthase [(2E,6E)-farnesyldiphosphate specific] n=1 Tax=Taphrina deformans (strain PYCC 5710 / ATCC 11124 / CBS 356.35 / IMI 108563 / JCM 9778 / NBRC 8474) TaxID=1097556 RepID=R4XBT3_TAPDE|nr:Di-trans,poly-cis-decaprenylcistransferase [Taphrina deformans PYCC 5710]|eukprot:CCG80805.1 Di-trans,poly-cis-decaprenylcistransferase [Taphrina deformans PYCC 5710]
MSHVMNAKHSAKPRYAHRAGKGRPSSQASRGLYAVLYSLHGIYHAYKSIQRLVNKLSDALAGFILTSNSREMIKSDISTLTKIPSHLAVIVHGRDPEKLINDVADLAAWTICSSIPILTIYEADGELKGMDSSLQIAIKRKIRRYFREMKKVILQTPAWGTSISNFAEDDTSIPDLEINILSNEDGREAILDVTRSLCKLVQPDQHSQELSHRVVSKSISNGPRDVSNAQGSAPTIPNLSIVAGKSTTPARHSEPLQWQARSQSLRKKLSSNDVTIPFLDAHLSASTISEPSLLLIFAPTRTLAGFPPWSIRLCEICHVGRVGRVNYRGYLQGLKRYGRAEMRFGH